MKALVILFVAFLGACVNPGTENVDVPTVVERPEVFATTVVDNLELTLMDQNGRCTLNYRMTSADPGNRKDEVIDLGIASPCNFIRKPGKYREYPPMTYSYRTGADRRTVILVTGGPPSKEFPEIKDQFMPNGCGTSGAKIRVFPDRVEKAHSSSYEGDPPRCPSGGADEVEFAT